MKTRWIVSGGLLVGVLSLAWSAAGPANSPAPTVQREAWTRSLNVVDDALARRDVAAAMRAWNEGYGAALLDRGWTGLVEMGDAILRIGPDGGGRKTAEMRARQAYLDALFRARGQGSVDGTIRVAEAFASLGDHDVAEHSLRIAGDLGRRGQDLTAAARVAEARERLGALRAATKVEVR